MASPELGVSGVLTGIGETQTFVQQFSNALWLALLWKQNSGCENKILHMAV